MFLKKAIAYVTAFAMMLTLSATVLAQQESGQQLEQLILKAKSVVDIPENLELSYTNMYTDEDGNSRWHLNWSNDSDRAVYWERTNVSVEIGDDGFIHSYSKHNYSTYRYTEYVRLPSIKKETADSKVKEFISRVCPQIEGEIEWAEPNVSDGNYFYNFRRNIGGVGVSFNYAYFTVDGVTGEINNYYSNWNSKMEFPSAENAISLEKAKEVFKQNMPLDLEYRIDYEGNLYVQYAPSREHGGKYINALTGEVEKPEYDYGLYGYGDMARERYYKESYAVAEVRLSPSEQKEVDEVSGTLTAKEAEEIVRSYSELKIDESYKLTGSNLHGNKIYTQSETVYYINLNFSKIEVSEDVSEEKVRIMIAAGEGRGHASATLNAKTGDLTYFTSYDWNEDMSKEKAYTKENSKEIAEAFINKVQPAKLDSLKYIENSEGNPNYQYARLENGAYFNYDGITVFIDEFSGKINNYSYNWTEGLEIPSLDKVIGSDNVHELLFANDGLKLDYILSGRKAVLVYKINDMKPQFFDAFNGENLDYSGKPYKDQSAPAYNDIEGHFSEDAVRELVSIGVFLNGESFGPDSNITQLEYLTLLSKLGMYRYEMDEKESLYSYVIRNGIMDETEKNPDANVTREDAVKYLLRFLNYKKFAEIPNIFQVDFEDADDIDPALTGYAAIAKGIGIVNGSNGQFKPKDVLTKGESAVIIYNCLKANLY